MKEIKKEDIKEIEKNILDYIVNVCEKNDISYFLCGGTLLGAVRHQGFIPWDDDVDIMLPRPDYERLLNVFPENTNYKLSNRYTERYWPYAYSKVRDCRTLKVEDKLRKPYSLYQSVDVDVFPIDGLPSSEIETALFYKKIALQQNLVECLTKVYGKAPGFVATIKKNFGILVFRILEALRLIELDKLIERYENLSKHYLYEEHEFVGITSISHYGIKEKNFKDSYSSICKVKFEGKMYNAPKGYNTYLSQLYGKKYMEMPPISKQKTHHTNNCFWI